MWWLALLQTIIIFVTWFPINTNADFLNDYLNGKRFGDASRNIGPCPENDKCFLDYQDLPDKIKDISICLTGNSFCGRIGDILKSGQFTIWDLVCQNVEIGNIELNRQQSINSNFHIKSTFEVTNFGLACSFRADIENVKLQVGNTAIITSIIDAGLSFPVRGKNGFVDASVELNLFTDVANREVFATDLPYRVTLPADNCDVGVGLGLDLEFSQITYLEICYDFGRFNFWSIFLLFGERCIVLLNANRSQLAPNLLSALLDFFNVDGVVSIIVRILEAFIGGIVCQVIEEFAVLSNPPGANGIINEELQNAKQIIDDYAQDGDIIINVADFDTDSYIASKQITTQQRENSLNFADSTVFETLSVGLNGWLGGPSPTSGYDLVVNELVDLITNPDGTFALDLVQEDLAPQVTLPLLVSDVTVQLKEFALEGFNTFEEPFSILENSLNTNSDKLRYTIQNALKVNKFAFEVDIFVDLSRGEWVTGIGSNADVSSSFSFTFSLSLEDLTFDSWALILFDFDRLDAVQVGQLTGLVDTIDTTGTTDEIINAATDALQCIAPAFYLFEFTDLHLSVDTVGDAQVKNFDGRGLSALIQSGTTLGADALRGALRDKLPKLSKSIIRTTINDLIKEYVTDPGKQGTQKCPQWKGPVGAPLVANFNVFPFNSVSQLIDSSVGGDPILDTGADINELIDTLITYFADQVTEFPVQRIDQGEWEIADQFRDALRFTPYVPDGSPPRPNDIIHVQNLKILNFDSIYLLRAKNLDTGGLNISFGIGGELEQPGGGFGPATPLQLVVPIDIQRDSDTREEFEVTLELSKLVSVFGISKLILAQDFFNALYLNQLQDLPCVLASLSEIEFADSLQQLSIEGINVGLNRINDSPSSSAPLNIALTNLENQLGPGYPEANGAFETLINTILKGSISVGLDLVEQVPSIYGNGAVTTENCSSAVDPLDAALDLFNTSPLPFGNATELLETCLATPVYQDVAIAERDVQVTDDDDVIELDSNPLLQLAKTVLDSVLADGADTVLQRLANATGAFVADIFVFDETSTEADPVVNLEIPLSLLGLKFENDDVIPGLIVDLGVVTIKGVNKFLKTLDLLQPVGRFTTRHQVIFDPTKKLDVSISASVTMDKNAIDTSTPLGQETVTEILQIDLRMDGFEFELDLLTAINPTALGDKTLGHFFTVDSAQTIFLTNTFVDCFIDIFYKGGLSITNLKLDVNSLETVGISAPNKVILDQTMEDVFAAVTDLVIDFYKDAVGPISQNCVRVFSNDVVQEFETIGECPDRPSPIPLQGENTLFRFNTSADFNLVQDLWSEFVIQDNYENLNLALKSVVGPAIFFDSSKDDQILFENVPVVYYGQSYGSVDLGLSNVQLENLEFTNLRVAQPYKLPDAPISDTPSDSATPVLTKENIGYTTLTQVEAKKMDLQFDLKLNANGLFNDIPEMKNDLRVKIKMEDLVFGLQLLTKINITSALELQFSTISSLEQLPCIIVPLEQIAPMDLNLSLSSVILEGTCLDQCDLPVFSNIGDVKVSSTNEEQLADLIKRGVDFASTYLEEINAQTLLDVQIATAEQSCEDLLDTITAFFSDAPPQTDVAISMGVSLVGIAAFLVLSYGAVYPVHKMRRKQALLKNIEASEKEMHHITQQELARIMTATELNMKSIFQHPATPVVVKWLIPLWALMNLVIIVVAVAFSGALSLVIQLTLFGAETVLWEVVPLTIASLINTLWVELSWIIGLALAVVVVAFPVGQNMFLLVLWFTPKTILNVSRKWQIVTALEMTGKIGFALVFILATTISALYTVFTANDYVNLNFVPPEVAGFELNVTPKRGMVLIAFVAMTTLVLSHVLAVYLQKTSNNSKKLQDSVDGIRNSEFIAGPRKAETSKVKIRDHVFTGRDRRGRVRKISPKVANVLLACSILALVMMVIGVLVPVIEFEVTGIAGIVLREISQDSPTVQEPLQLKPFSLVTIGASVGNAPKLDVVDTISIAFLQFAFFLIFIITPIFHMVMVILCLAKPMSLKAIRINYWTERVFFRWAGLDLACVVLVAMLFLIGPLVRTYVNFISSQVIAPDLCESSESLLQLLVPDPEKDAFCMSTEARLLWGFSFTVFALCLQFVVSFVFSVLAGAAISDRYVAAYHGVRSDAEMPRKLSKLSIMILNYCTVVVGGVQDGSRPPPGTTPPLGTSVFRQNEFNEDADLGSSSFCASCCSYYYTASRRESRYAGMSATDRRIQQWLDRFDTATPDSSYALSPVMSEGSSPSSSSTTPRSKKSKNRQSRNPIYDESRSRRNQVRVASPAGRPIPPTPPSYLFREDSIEV